MSLRIVLFLAALGPTSCLWLIRPGSAFNEADLPAAPDYADTASWAALPDRKDAADLTPAASSLKDEQASVAVDVFFVHPTLFFGRSWNADVKDSDVNNRVDSTTIQRQASVFNCCARIYAPRYRQATLSAFLDKENGARALDAAYSDVLRAFDYYMMHHNKGRRIIIASHSQGSRHAMILLKDRFDGKALREQLVAAYLIGMAIPISAYKTIPACDRASQTKCFVSYRAFTEGAEVKTLVHDPAGPYACTNPITWKNDSQTGPAENNEGGVSGNFEKIDPHVCSARCEAGVLRISEPAVSGYGSVRGSYHVSDYGLFYINLQTNIRTRIKASGP